MIVWFVSIEQFLIYLYFFHIIIYITKIVNQKYETRKVTPAVLKMLNVTRYIELVIVIDMLNLSSMTNNYMQKTVLSKGDVSNDLSLFQRIFDNLLKLLYKLFILFVIKNLINCFIFLDNKQFSNLFFIFNYFKELYDFFFTFDL